MSSYIFGPVPSRRLGRSLGVDLIPYKTCTYDCIYCQLGRTTRKTLEQKEWVPRDDVLSELEGRLDSRPDYITLGGSGEPTLHSRIGELIDRIKEMTGIPVAVLTNGSLLWQEETRVRLMKADLIMPSLDACEDRSFRTVNRPHDAIRFEKMVEGLRDFRRQFRGQLWLEVFLLAGYTASEAAVAGLAEIARRIRPDRVQLNTVARPTVESHAIGVSPERMAGLALMFDPPAEVIASYPASRRDADFSAGLAEVLELLRRRPCTLDDIANGLGLHRAQAAKLVEILADDKKVEKTETGGNVYFKRVARF
jgi:wyosine [tRNA(Phe)-imidazoG37] synthetase (radical SAM superfamily)